MNAQETAQFLLFLLNSANAACDDMTQTRIVIAKQMLRAIADGSLSVQVVAPEAPQSLE